jgi:hypothetical protein
MDKETLYEALIEVLKNGPYRKDAEELFREEISVCVELTEEDKRVLVRLISSLGGTDIDMCESRAREIARLISRSSSLATYILERLA